MNKLTNTQKKMKHSKFKNTGILFELLTKQVTADIISGKTSSPASTILHKFFNKTTEIGKEWQLYNKLLNEKIKSEQSAERYYSTVVDIRKTLSNNLLAIEKYELIKEIKNIYPLEQMLKSPVRNYRTLASIYKLFENATSSNVKFELDEIYQAKTVIVEHLVNKPSLIKEEDKTLNFYKSQTEDIRLLTYKLLTEKLNEKYSSILDDEQKTILKEYICNVSNTNKFDILVSEHISKIKNKLNETVGNISGSDVIKIKIKEVIKQLDNINVSKGVKDSHVTVLMLSYELLKEINSQIKSKTLLK